MMDALLPDADKNAFRWEKGRIVVRIIVSPMARALAPWGLPSPLYVPRHRVGAPAHRRLPPGAGRRHVVVNRVGPFI